jgi:hypothetical protein
MDRARPWKLDPHGIAKVAPMGGERGERKIVATLGTNIIAGIVRNSFILPPKSPKGGLWGTPLPHTPRIKHQALNSQQPCKSDFTEILLSRTLFASKRNPEQMGQSILEPCAFAACQSSVSQKEAHSRPFLLG